MSSAPVKIKSFRPEIQALRALAVLLVVAYHLEPGVLPGGYIGVDIFFVISGFLITSHLLREAQRTGTVNFASFFAGRARRILPAAMLVIVVVVVAGLLILPKTLWGTLGIQALASTFSVQNWVLAADSVDYLAAEEAAGPLQHFWSLGVEEQFYLFWPLVVLAVCLLVKQNLPGPRTDRFASRRRVIFLSFMLIALISLGYSIFTGYSGDAAGYFITTTRIWELAVGGLLAVLMDAHANGSFTLPRWTESWAVRNGLVLISLLSILGAALTYDAQTVFPGIAAALPVLSCAAIIVAGDTRGLGSLHLLVQWKPVQWVGLASYSLYLWHWPLIVFVTHLLGHDPNPIQSLVLLAGSLVFAWASLKFVESPARRFTPLAGSAKLSLVAGAAAVAVVAGTALIPGIAQRESIEKDQQAVAQLIQDPPAGLGAASVGSGAPAYLPETTQIIPVPATAEDDQPDLGACVQDPQSTQIKECEFGSKNATFTVALVGDSHAAHWFEALSEHAKERGWKVVTYLKNSCPFSATERTAERDGGINCSEANKQTLEKLKSRGDINAVVAANWAGASFVDDAAQGYAQQWSKLEDAGLPVYAVVDTPRPPKDEYARDCVEEHSADPEACSFDKSAAFESGDVTKQAAKLEPRVKVLDFSDQFCIDGRCPSVIGNVLVYRDKHHISDTYMRTLATVFGERLESAMNGQ
ncbi:acyltransferase family protein [Arthrobacter sp. MYb213]|uniref:acyltransferase family protein n=1 Tax=Arthrobacter sp. MYb213 TaxID=1848595 RepID=UPI000CFA9453|nr:acyltransferase family protein [Arthrobacter sp. MYb213]PRB70151.1 acyltransferase [Arthrobacter sp. MYb213]